MTRPTTQRPNPLATFNGPQVGLMGVGWGCCVLKYSPGEAGGGGAGPAGWAGPMGAGAVGVGRGLSCTCRSARSCWTTAPPWACGPRSTRWAGAPAPEARSTAPPTRPGCAGCTGPGPAGRVRGVRVGGRGEDAATLPASLPISLSPHLPLSYLIPCLSGSLPLPMFHSWPVSHCPSSPSIFRILYPPTFFSLILSPFHSPSISPPLPSPKLGLSHFSRVRLCDPMDCSLPGSSVHGVSQAKILEWAAISFSRGSS